MDLNVEAEAKPERVRAADVERIATMEKTPVKELRDIPAHYVLSQVNNPDIDACCRDVNNLSFQAFKTEAGLANPNLGVMECAACNRKHYRVAHSPGKP